MNKYGLRLLGLLLSTCLMGQTGLQLTDAPVRLFSSTWQDLHGVLTFPDISPHSPKIVSFVRIDGDHHYLYIYDVVQQLLTRVSVAGEYVGAEPSEPPEEEALLTYTAELDWRPVLDDQGRQWFAFVSNGAENNYDIYLGVVGQPTYVRLTTNEAVESNPRWSPDGKSLAFISTRTGEGDIYLIEGMDKVIEQPEQTQIELKQLTDTPLEEMDLAWNPNPKSYLLAYAARETFEGRDIGTFQIRVLNLKAKENPIYRVTDDPLRHYTRPLWDPIRGNRLIYIGREILPASPAVVYIAELTWGKDDRLHNVEFEGYQEEVFRNVRPNNSRAIWLPGGKAVLLQENRPEQDYPIYSIDVDRWLARKPNAVHYFQELHAGFPGVEEYDVAGDYLFFTAREGEDYFGYLARIYGPDIDPHEPPHYVLNNPGAGARWFTSGFFWAGATVAAGAATFFILQGGGEPGTGIQALPIGLPPSAPEDP
ncbi:MAG: hypothetical protein D6681_16125 [Calditrichaeota bacterium]|nr:MAG: hypothetical protein D6681_16125 [Calditrichota bacterium]